MPLSVVGFFILVVSAWSSAHARLACANAAGAPVDWWAALKAPGIDARGNHRYAYLDSTSPLGGEGYTWMEGEDLAGTADNPMAATLAPLYAASQEMVYVMWNDEPPHSFCPDRPHGCTSFVLGHSKGVLGMANSTGFWLSHSVPKFPDSPDEAEYGGIYQGQTLNGQSFLCVSLLGADLEAVAGLLRTADLDIYSPKTFSSGVLDAYPNVSKLLLAAKDPDGPVLPTAFLDRISFHTAAGERMVAFAKSSTGNGGDVVRMWEDVVEAGLHANMDVQSWPEGMRVDYASYCGPPDSPYASITIDEIAVPGTQLAWRTRVGAYRDHSKWAVSTSPGARVLCEGDNNRAQHQGMRGGTALCFADNEAVWLAYMSVIAGTTPCRERRAGSGMDVHALMLMPSWPA